MSTRPSANLVIPCAAKSHQIVMDIRLRIAEFMTRKIEL